MALLALLNPEQSYFKGDELQQYAEGGAVLLWGFIRDIHVIRNSLLKRQPGDYDP